MLKVVNPATEQVMRELPEDTAEAVAKKFERAQQGLAVWQTVALADRKQAIAAFKSALVEKTDELAEVLVSEMGKPIRQARDEIVGSAERIDFFLAHVDDLLESEQVFQYPELLDEGQSAKLREQISYEPMGVVACISSWSFPYYSGIQVFVPALLTGNSVLYKPSEQASLSGQLMADLLHKSGVPKDAFVPVVGGAEVGGLVVGRPLDALYFNGSYASGVEVATKAAARIIPALLELGGKDAVYVCEDVNVVSVAASVADGAFYNSGQSSCAVERIYVHRGIYKAFVDAFVGVVEQFVVGDPTDKRTYIGPVARQQQLDLLQAHTDDAVARGATVLCGGHRRESPGFYFEPTVISGADNTMRVMREETYGPVVGLMPVADDDEAVLRINDSEYGLTASVYTDDEKRARAILSQFNTGTVYWNTCDRISPRLPVSGRKHSGIGTTLSAEGMRAFLRPKAWHLMGC